MTQAPNPSNPSPEKKGLSGCAIAGIGCGVLLLLGVIIAGAGAWYVASNFRSLASGATTTVLKESIKELRLPADQQARIEQRIDELGSLYEQGTIDLEDFVPIMEKITQGPLLTAGAALMVERKYLDRSNLADEQKAQVRQAVQRFMRGSMDKAIPEATRDQVMQIVTTPGSGPQRELKDTLSDAELLQFAEAAAEAADAASVPEKVEEVNLADAFDEAVDAALQDLGVQPAAQP